MVKAVQSMSERHLRDQMEFRLLHAVLKAEREEAGNHLISVGQARDAIRKFGRNPNIDTGVSETVWETGGDEAYQAANTIDRIVSTDNADNQTLQLRGHTILNGEFTLVTQTVTLNGQTPVALAIPLARADQLDNSGVTTAVAGNVSVYRSVGATVTAGEVTPTSQIHVALTNGDQQGKKCAFTTARDQYAFINAIGGSLLANSGSARVDVKLEVRDQGGVFREQARFSLSTQLPSYDKVFETLRIVGPNSDVRLEATTTSNNTIVSGDIEAYFAKVTALTNGG